MNTSSAFQKKWEIEFFSPHKKADDSRLFYGVREIYFSYEFVAGFSQLAPFPRKAYRINPLPRALSLYGGGLGWGQTDCDEVGASSQITPGQMKP